MLVLSSIIGLASTICFIIVLVKQFKTGGALHGIIGLVTCGIWTFIWGWINARQGQFTNLMLIWTGLTVVGLILNAVMVFNFNYAQSLE